MECTSKLKKNVTLILLALEIFCNRDPHFTRIFLVTAKIIKPNPSLNRVFLGGHKIVKRGRQTALNRVL